MGHDTFIIANPAACGGMTENRRRLLERLASELGATLIGLSTNSPEEFSSLISASVNEGDTAVFAGGDGTLHHGLCVLRNRKVTIGYLPFGTGNAAAYAFGFYKPGIAGFLKRRGLAELIDYFSTGVRQKVDLLEIEAECLPEPAPALFASVGWCAAMAGQRKSKGLTGYIVPALRNLIGPYYRQETELFLDDKPVWDGRSTFIVFSKCKFYGAGVTMVPDARLNDGLIHLAVYKRTRPGLLATYIWSFIGGRPVPDACATGRDLLCTSRNEKIPLQLDGEYVGTTARVHCRIKPGAISVLLPPDTT